MRVRGEYAGPYTLLVIADLLGVPEADHEEFLTNLMDQSHAEMTHKPLEYLYARFTTYIEDRTSARRRRRTTGLATATFPDGTLPPVDDVMRIAPTGSPPARRRRHGCSARALQTLGERPARQQQLRDDRRPITPFIEEMLRLESPIKGTFRLSRVPTIVGQTQIPGSTVMVLPSAANRDPR